jgi:hypothetical protein
MRSIGVAVLLMISGCTTVFYGQPMFPGGPRGCQVHCAQNGLQMSSFVYAGEYSTACICSPQGQPAAAADTDATTAAIAAVQTMRQSQNAAAQSQVR